MHCKVVAYLTTATLLSIGAGHAGAQAAPPTSVRDSINAFYRAWSEASMTRGAEGYASYFGQTRRYSPRTRIPCTGVIASGPGWIARGVT